MSWDEIIEFFFKKINLNFCVNVAAVEAYFSTFSASPEREIFWNLSDRLIGANNTPSEHVRCAGNMSNIGQLKARKDVSLKVENSWRDEGPTLTANSSAAICRIGSHFATLDRGGRRQHDGTMARPKWKIPPELWTVKVRGSLNGARPAPSFEVARVLMIYRLNRLSYNFETFTSL